MSSERYTILSDLPRGRMRVKVTGFWDRATADRFQAEVLSAFNRMRKIHKYYDAIFDMTELEVLPADVAAAIQEFWKTIPENGPDHVAVVVNRALLKMQSERLAPDASIRRFADEAAAMEWLEQKS